MMLYLNFINNYFILLFIHFLTFLSVKPNERPQVFGFKPRYRVGDTLSMTCFVNNTFPAANLTWFINGKRVIIYQKISKSYVIWLSYLIKHIFQIVTLFLNTFRLTITQQLRTKSLYHQKLGCKLPNHCYPFS